MADRSERGHGLIVVCGPCGCGKTTVGEALAAALMAPFLEGDRYHSEANRTKMQQGVPLTDADRQPWLETLRTEAEERLLAGNGTVVLACSALRAVYRDTLRPRTARAHFFLLAASEAELIRRVGSRPDHYMPVDLVRSQLTTLERGPDLIELDATRAVDPLVAEIIARLNGGHPSPDEKEG
jgi:gluconokinase